MPQGFGDLREAQLGTAVQLLKPEDCSKIASWWLAFPSPRANTPNWDIASTCSIDGKRGLLLIEAKAHHNELLSEAHGKQLRQPSSPNSLRNHEHIAERIQDACKALRANTKLHWSLSRDRHYQLSNRFASAAKLLSMGYPVILVYLGFLRAEEMRDRGKPFETSGEWEELVRSQSKTVVPREVWQQKWIINERSFVALIRSLQRPLVDVTCCASSRGRP